MKLALFCWLCVQFGAVRTAGNFTPEESDPRGSADNALHIAGGQ